MFLPLLSEKQKYLFLEFAFAMASADNVIAIEEHQTIDAYRAEMELGTTEIPSQRPIDDILLDIKEISDPKERKIFIFEILGLVLSDGEYDTSEKEIIKKALQYFDLGMELENKCIELIQTYLQIQQEINALILNKE